MAVRFNKYPFCRIHMQASISAKTTFARIDFLRQGEHVVDKKGTHNVKMCAEKLTTYRVDELTSRRACWAASW